MRPLYIFDIDGTLCDIRHRLYLLDTTNPDRWDKFYKACVYDKPNMPVVAVLQALLLDAENDVWFFSGRSEDVRKETVAWLTKHTGFSTWTLEHRPELLTMRPSKDYTEDHLMKEKWLLGMLDVDRDRLVCVFDDRKRVVDMWRNNGVTCLQVAPGEF